jgi:hypothetical protein
MAAWRRKLIALFPDLRAVVCEADYTTYSAFFDLLPRCRDAHTRSDIAELSRIYGFAEWCLNQKSEKLWNPAGVCFYEHLFDSSSSLWSEIIPWLSPAVIASCMGLWESRLSNEEMRLLESLLKLCDTKMYLTIRES